MSIFDNIKVNNINNKYIVDEFIRYYIYINNLYGDSNNKSNDKIENKTNKEIYYKLQVIKKTIDIISKFKNQIESGNDLKDIKGIGPKTINRINEIIKTGKLKEISNIKNKTENDKYKSITELSNIFGIGSIKAATFYKKYNIKSINELIDAYNNNKISLTRQMLLGLKYKDNLVNKIPHDLIKFSEKFIINKILNSDNDFIVNICGSYRRNKSYSSDIDILITHKGLSDKTKAAHYLNDIVNALDKIFIIDYLTKSFKTHFQGFATFKNIPYVDKFNNKNKLDFDIINNVIRLDIIIVPHDSYYTALMHFTGSGEFNQKLRLHAKSLNMKLSEYGLYNKINNHYTKIKINSEQDIFKHLLLKYVEPPNRI